MCAARTSDTQESNIPYQAVDKNDNKTNKNCCGDVMKDKQRFAMIVIILLFTLIVPISIYFIVTHLTFELQLQYSCSVDSHFRVLCSRANITKDECTEINCCYDEFTTQCYHYVPSKYNYIREERESNTFSSLQSLSPFKKETIQNMAISMLDIDAQRLKLVLHSTNITYNSQNINEKDYYIKTDEKILGVEVVRKNTGELILSTLLGPLIASYLYWEWSIHLVSDNFVGLGEVAYKPNETVTKIIYKNKYDHNTLPNFLCSYNGSYYGVRVEHEGPLEVTVLPSKLIILKSLAGDTISVNIYMGPNLADVINQQKQEKTQTPLVPYWTLGAHLCRDGLTDIDAAIKEYTEFYNSQSNIQFASDCVHENLYIMLNELNANHNLEGLIQDLQTNSHFVMSIPPQIAESNKNLYGAAVSLDILLRNHDGDYLHGTYRNNDVGFPDFNHTSIDKWFEELKKNLPSSSIDGFVLKDNWPEEEKYILLDDSFPYMTQGLNMSLSHTIPWNLSSKNMLPQPHILQHHLYGKYQTVAFKRNIQTQFLSTSSYDYELSEATFIQNVNISWTNLKKALVTTLYNSVLGNPLIGFPVCGSSSTFDPNTNEDLCVRWYMMAATFPLLRISSDLPRRDPFQLNTGYARSTSLNAIKKRYMFLPYYYTTLYLNEPLTRPMFYNFPHDNQTWNLEHQYMLGNSLLVAQPLYAAITKLYIYLPRDVKVWYEYWGGNPYINQGHIQFNIVKSDWIMFIAEGHIVPLRQHFSSKIGEYNEKDSYSFAVALNCTTLTQCYAEGQLQLNTHSITITGNNKEIIIENILKAQTDIGCDLAFPNYPRYISNVKIYGLQQTVLKSNFDIIDLCKSGDSLTIQYFKI